MVSVISIHLDGNPFQFCSFLFKVLVSWFVIPFGSSVVASVLCPYHGAFLLCLGSVLYCVVYLFFCGLYKSLPSLNNLQRFR